MIFAVLTVVTVSAQKAKTLTIFHTNDVHSCVLPMSEHLADTTVAGRGGFLRRITMLNEERTKDPEMLYLDAGDFSQGSPYYTMFKGDVEIELMNRMRCDASTLGNHEWDFGLENLARITRMAKFPIVCSNYDFTGTELDGLIKPYIILKRKGVKIGVFAVCPKMEGLVAAKNYGSVVYHEPIPCALKMATMLKKEQKCDVVICISHIGWGEEGDIAIAKGTKYIDLILGGHSHTNLPDLQYIPDLDGHDVCVNQNGKAGIHVSKITMEVGR